ncbi:hypothetical protein WAI453_005061 [Rhynchosporium graminicola]
MGGQEVGAPQDACPFVLPSHAICGRDEGVEKAPPTPTDLSGDDSSAMKNLAVCKRIQDLRFLCMNCATQLRRTPSPKQSTNTSGKTKIRGRAYLNNVHFFCIAVLNFRHQDQDQDKVARTGKVLDERTDGDSRYLYAYLRAALMKWIPSRNTVAFRNSDIRPIRNYS